MTILFANPPWWTVDANQLRRGIRAGSRWPFTMPSGYQPDRFQFGHYLPYPFFLGAAAAYAERVMDGEHTVILRDSIARGESYQAFFAYVAELRPDVVILETGAASWQHDRTLLVHLKKMRPTVRIAVAGPTAKTAYDAEAVPGQAVGPADAFLQGEYEKNAVDFIRGASGLLPFQMLSREELARVPFPMFDEVAALHYWDACPQGQQAPHLQLLTSRGCPYKCCFCAWPATMTGNDPDGTKARSVRFYSPEWVESFIRDRMAKAFDRGTPLRSIYLDDDTFNLADKHTLAIAEVMRRIGLPWSAMCRADTSSREAWQAMKDAGCFGVKLGIESISQRVVDEIVNKRLDVPKALETAKWLRSIGMTVHLTLTVGLPGERPEERAATMEFARTCQRDGFADTYQLSGTATIEGTPLDALAKGEALKAYPGAVASGFMRDADGVHKMEALNK